MSKDSNNRDKSSLNVTDSPVTTEMNDSGVMQYFPSELYASLRQHPLFSNASPEFIQQISSLMHFRSFQPDDVIVREGEMGRAMFFLIRGTVKVVSEDRESEFAEINQGSFFGEIAVLFSVPRTATIIAKTKCLITILTTKQLMDILPSYPEIAEGIQKEAEDRYSQFRKRLRTLGREHKGTSIRILPSSTGSTSTFFTWRTIPEEALDFIDKKYPVQKVEKNQILIHKGDMTNDFYIVKDGSLQVSSADGSQVYMVLHDGQYFGEVSPLYDVPRTATVKALELSDVYVLSKNDMQTIFQKYPDCKTKITFTAKQTFDHMLTEGHDPNTFETLAEEFESPSTPPAGDSITANAFPTVADPIKIANPSVASLRSAGMKKRRDSVAVWAEPKLAELASNAAKKHNRILQTLTQPGSPHIVNGKKSFGAIKLTAKQLVKIFQKLPFQSLLQCYRTCKEWSLLITQHEEICREVDLCSINKKITDSSLLSIGPFLQNRTKVLSLRNCWHVTNLGIHNLSGFINVVEVLCLASCWEITDVALQRLGKQCLALTTVDLSNCRKIQDVGLESLLQLAGIKSLQLSYCKNLSDVSTANFAKNANKLVDLGLQRCTGINDEGFSTWNNVDFPKMKLLNFSDCSFLSDTTITTVCKSCRNISSLNISFCANITEASVVAIAENCHYLHRFEASFCTSAISDNSLEKLAKSKCSSVLKYLSIRGCSKVTENGITILLNELCKSNNISLKYFIISNCKNLSETFKQQLNLKYTKIKFG